MRPCPVCGKAIPNNLDHCEGCDPADVAESFVPDLPVFQRVPDDRSEYRNFLAIAFVVLVIVLPGICYLLGNVFYGVTMLVVGAILFGLLEQMTH